MVVSKSKQMNVHPDEAKSQQIEDFPRIYRFFDSDSIVHGREKRIEKDL